MAALSRACKQEYQTNPDRVQKIVQNVIQEAPLPSYQGLSFVPGNKEEKPW